MKDMKGNLWEEMKDNPLGPSVWKPLENAAWSSDAVREDMMLPLKIAYSDLSTWHPKRLGVTATGVLTWRRRAKRRGLVSLRDVTPMDPQELTRVR
jgi:hypothetical protein